MLLMVVHECHSPSCFLLGSLDLCISLPTLLRVRQLRLLCDQVLEREAHGIRTLPQLASSNTSSGEDATLLSRLRV